MLVWHSSHSAKDGCVLFTSGIHGRCLSVNAHTQDGMCHVDGLLLWCSAAAGTSLAMVAQVATPWVSIVGSSSADDRRTPGQLGPSLTAAVRRRAACRQHADQYLQCSPSDNGRGLCGRSPHSAMLCCVMCRVCCGFLPGCVLCGLRVRLHVSAWLKACAHSLSS